ncbi:MAG: caspase family protein [Polaromonas sp.]|nr:caspase family protein [Polaromonas sp.]
MTFTLNLNHRKKFFVAVVSLFLMLEVFAQTAAPGQILTTVRATELRSDKLGSATVLSSLAAGVSLRLLSAEGGWTMVEAATSSDKASPKIIGWVRASSVNWQTGASNVSRLVSGREAAGNTALTLGVRSMPPRVNRHALIIGISRYADAATPPLPGARIDKESATQMAQAMQVPTSNIRYLQDEQATGNSIRAALKELTGQVQEGDRVFIHYSGHGTRYNDPVAGGCVEALLAYEGGSSGMITNHEMADMLKTITNKTDKLFVMYDACHSGGLAQAATSVRTRGALNGNDEGLLRPKFSSITEECGRPVNVKTRNLLVEATATGALPQDIIHVSASRDNEISFDDELKGGLATQFMRDCMLRDAVDLDNSGAISMDEIRQCAQVKINKRMANDVNYKPHNLVLNGNAAFVPAWFSQPSAVAAPLATAPVVLTPPALTGEKALLQMFDQRDAKRRVQVTAAKEKLKIGQDTLDFSVQSDRAGYVYVALAGSDNKALYLLFPNDLDQNNKIEAGQKMQLPRPNWRVKAAGPVGTDNLLVMVADAPRDLTALAVNKAGPFVSSFNDAQGRAKLGALMTTSQLVVNQTCLNTVTRRNNPLCSDAYGAAMLAIEETK